MNLYKKESSEISTYLRTNKIVLNNPLNGVPDINIYEEKVLDISGDVTTKPVAILSKAFTASNALTEFPLLHPETLEPTGDMVKYSDVYAIIASLYLAMARERDEAESNPEPIEPPNLEVQEEEVSNIDTFSLGDIDPAEKIELL